MTPVLLGLQALLAALELFKALRTQAVQNGELTAAQDAELLRQYEAKMAEAHWQIDP